MKGNLKLILVTNRGEAPLNDYLEFIKVCAHSGITSVQLREKNASLEFIRDFGLRLKSILIPLEIPLIINDHLELASDLDAEGVHLGQADADPVLAGQILGQDKVIGLSIESNAELYRANLLPVTYVAASAVFSSQNKSNTRMLWGIDGLSHFVKESKHPVVAIGGINHTNALEVLKTGVAGIAVIDAIHKANSPEQAVQALRQIIDQGER